MTASTTKEQTSSACFERDIGKNEDHHGGVQTVVLIPTVFEKGATCEFDIFFTLSNCIDPYVDNSFTFDASATTISIDSNNNNDNSSWTIAVRYVGNFAFSGSSVPYVVAVETNSSDFPQNVQAIRESLSPISHIYTISNIGRIALKHVLFTVEWPAYFWTDEGRMDLLYIYNMSCNTAINDTLCSCGSSIVVDAYNIFRSFNAVLPDAASRLPTVDISQNIQNCEKSPSNCTVNVYCNVSNVFAKSMVEIQIQSIAFPNSMSKVESPVRVSTTATAQMTEFKSSVILEPSHKLVVQISNEIAPKRSYVPFDEENAEWKVHWLVYFLSAAAGLLLLILIALALRQMGFFKSKYAQMKEDMQKRQEDESAAPLKA